MTTETREGPPGERILQRTQRIVLGLLAVSAVSIVVHGFEGEEPPPDRALATAGVLLALGAIVLRRVGSSPVIQPRTALLFRLTGLLLCAGLGGLGLYLAFGLDSPENGILFTLAGVIFALRPSVAITPRRT